MGSNIYQEAAQKTLKEKMPEALRGAVPEALKRINTRPEYGLYDASISKKGALSVFMKLHSHKEGLDEKDLSILIREAFSKAKVPREERGKSWPSEREVEEFAKAAANSRLTKEMRSEAELQIAEVGKLAEFKQSVAPFINLVAGVLGTAAAIWVAVDAATLPAKELFARVLQGPLGIFTPGKGGATPEWALATLAALYFAYRVIASAYKSADGDEAWRSLNRLIEQLRGDGQ